MTSKESKSATTPTRWVKTTVNQRAIFHCSYRVGVESLVVYIPILFCRRERTTPSPLDLAWNVVMMFKLYIARSQHDK